MNVDDDDGGGGGGDGDDDDDDNNNNNNNNNNTGQEFIWSGLLRLISVVWLIEQQNWNWL
jgi:hypothetical protein